MKIRYLFARHPGGRQPFNVAGMTAALCLVAGLAHSGLPESEEIAREMGRRIYEQGHLPDGTPLQAMRSGDVLLEGARAACVTCHRHSGMGSVEGSGASSVLVPPVAGRLLFKPAHFHGRYLDRTRSWIPNNAWARALTRSSYDAQSLGRALREGVDADEKPLQIPMPRYQLDDESIAALAAYLNQLAAAEAPGVGADVLHLATVVTPDAPTGHADAVLGVLHAWAQRVHSSQGKWKLHVWRLSGDPESWNEQLAAQYRKQPVFAMLSGAGRAAWLPIHQFCEARHLPCILPSVEVIPENHEGFYSIYYSPGVALEARVLARHFNTHRAANEIVQVVSDVSGEHAARELRQHLYDNALQAEERTYSFGHHGDLFKNLPRDGALVLWLRPEELRQLIETSPHVPEVEYIYLSGLLAAPRHVELPPEWKARVHWVSLFDDLGVQTEIAKLRLQHWLRQYGLPDNGLRRVQADAYVACYLFSSALAEISKQEVRRSSVPLNREHLIETLEELVNKYSDGTRRVNPESHVAYYGRMSMGPGQRVAVRGGALLRYSSPQSRKLVMSSDRIVP